MVELLHLTQYHGVMITSKVSITTNPEALHNHKPAQVLLKSSLNTEQFPGNPLL